MATRSQICIKQDTEGFKETGGIFIYKHNDGYPEGVMQTLAPLVKHFHETRGNDACYLLAQIVRAFAFRDFAMEPMEAPLRCTGWGLDTVKHGDIDYLYEINAATGEIYINGKPA